MIDLKTKILTWVTTTQKATGAMLMGATTLATATFIPEPFNLWAASAVVLLTWVVTYFVPFVQTLVETFPEDVLPVAEPVATGEVVEPETVEIAAITPETQGIPVVEGEDMRPVLTVDDVLNRLAAEEAASA